MSRRDRMPLRLSARGQLAMLAGLLVAVLSGCGSPASPEQLEAIARLQELGARINFNRGGYEVNLTETVVSNRDLAHLQKIEDLRSVDLQGTPITDESVEHLAPLESLEFLSLRGTKLTPMAVESLRKALPNTEIQH